MSRSGDESGFALVELLLAMLVIAIALLGLAAAYDAAFYSIHASAKTSSATLLANDQLELYSSLPYASVGLDKTTLASVQAGDAEYTSDEAALGGPGGTDVSIAGCGATPQCLPVQVETGSDGHDYRLETFVRDVANGGTTERVVTVVVRDESTAGTPKVLTLSSAFDATSTRPSS